jgi:hypothetical protein
MFDMKKIQIKSYQIRSNCLKVFTPIFFIAVWTLFLTSPALAKQCVHLFETDYTSITFQQTQRLAGMVSEKMNAEWSEGSQFISLSEGHQHTVFSAAKRTESLLRTRPADV